MLKFSYVKGNIKFELHVPDDVYVLNDKCIPNPAVL